MKRMIFAMLAAVAVVSSIGCAGDGWWGQNCCSNCPGQNCGCGQSGCGGCARSAPSPAPVADAGPPTAAVAYPYYTTRGPRDFFAKNPPSIGP